MEFFFIFTLWWLELHTITAMVDYQSTLEGWLEEATLFPAEHNDYLNFDDLLNSQKIDKDGLLIDPWSGLQWLEENVKLDINNDPNTLTFLPNETEAIIDECVKSFLPELLLDSEALVLPSDERKQEIDNITEPESIIPSSPVSNILPVPCYEPISAASSPESYVSDIPVDSTWYGPCSSPASASDSGSSDVAPSVVSVMICHDEEVGSEPSVPMTIEEIASSIKERKFTGKDGKVPKVTLKNTFHPYSRSKSGSRKKRTSDPGERKKVQNKEAAARYRMKKRSEEKELADEVNSLEKEQKKLQTKHDDILSEIKYLKGLMCEMLQKKGLM